MTGIVPYFLLGLGIVIGLAGQVLLKTGAMRSADAGAQFFSLWSICGLAAYGFAAIAYMLAIRRIPLSVAYPTVSISYVIMAVIAHLLWNEPLGWQQAVAFVLILSGIFVLYRA